MERKKLHWWIRFGCFLSGWNKNILRNCSEHSFKELKRVTAAIIIISLIWFFVFYKFAKIYLDYGNLGSIIAGLIGIIIVIQIEKQIVLHISKTKWISTIRIVMAVLMALLASTIFDQVIFKGDIDYAREKRLQNKVEKLLPIKEKQYNDIISDLESDLNKQDKRRQNLQKQLDKKPKEKMYTRVPKTETIFVTDSLGNRLPKDTTIYRYEFKEVISPKFKDLDIITKEINNLKEKILEHEQKKISLREDIEKELKSKTPFLEELDIMIKEILLKSPIALVFWIILFLFLGLLELLVLFASMGICDYEEIVMAQKENNSPKSIKQNNSPK